MDVSDNAYFTRVYKYLTFCLCLSPHVLGTKAYSYLAPEVYIATQRNRECTTFAFEVYPRSRSFVICFLIIRGILQISVRSHANIGAIKPLN